jgi:hypothetical protein
MCLNKSGNMELLVHYGQNAALMEGLPVHIARYDIGEGKRDEKTEKTSFTMRVSNNIHNVACLEEVEFIQEWTEEEKIPIKSTPPPTPPPTQEEAPPKDKPAEGDAKPAEGNEEKK